MHLFRYKVAFSKYAQWPNGAVINIEFYCSSITKKLMNAWHAFNAYIDLYSHNSIAIVEI